MIRVSHGSGFELHERLGVLWARVWWNSSENRAAFARPLLNALGAALAAADRATLVLDLREAPPMAHFGARQAISAVLTAAEAHRIPVSVIVGPTELQARDLHRLVTRHASVFGRVVAASIVDELPRRPAERSGSGFRRLAA